MLQVWDNIVVRDAVWSGKAFKGVIANGNLFECDVAGLRTKPYFNRGVDSARIQSVAGRVIAKCGPQIALGDINGGAVREVRGIDAATEVIHAPGDAGRYATVWSPGKFELIDLVKSEVVAEIENRRFNTQAAMSHNGRYLITGNADIKLYQLGEAPFGIVRKLPEQCSGQVYNYCFDPSEEVFAASDLTGILFFRSRDLSFIDRVELNIGFSNSGFMQFSSDGRRLIVERGETGPNAHQSAGLAVIDTSAITKPWNELVTAARAKKPSLATQAELRADRLRQGNQNGERIIGGGSTQE